MFSVQKIIFFSLIFSSITLCQENVNYHARKLEIKQASKLLDNKEDKKITKEFIRVFSSLSLSSEVKKNIVQVLQSFHDRGLQFNTYYINFFKLFLLIHDKEEHYDTLKKILEYLSLDTNLYSNSDLKTFLIKLRYFVDSNILNKNQYFTWEINGDYNFSFNESKKPIFHFHLAKLILYNSYDTIVLNNTNGIYHIFDNKFDGFSGDINYVNGDVNYDISFADFSLDLNKKFFQIQNAKFVSNSKFHGSSSGVYKDKLVQTNNYPKFKSNSNDELFEIFEGMQINSGVEVQGNTIFFYKNNIASSLTFTDDQLNYSIDAFRFKLSKAKLLASNAKFLIYNSDGSLSHPFVNFEYNDNNKTILIDRSTGTRGLNPIRNRFHGLNMYVDRLEIDLVYDQCLLFHYAQANDPRVLIESDTYFDRSRFQDLLRFDVNPIILLKNFMVNREFGVMYSLFEFSYHANLDVNTILDLVLDLEIFGFLDYDSSLEKFIVKPWYLDFLNSEKGEYDYDSFKIETLAGVGDTVANIDLVLNEMDLFGVQKINLTNRFNISLSPSMNELKFIGNKDFLFKGDVYVGNFAFSGDNILFNYHDFSLDFGSRSLLTFIDNIDNKKSSSFIHFDDANLYLDTLSNKSGSDLLNDYPKLFVSSQAYLSYNNNPVNFSIEPFHINYLTESSLENISFLGDLHLDGIKTDLNTKLYLDSTNNLSSSIKLDSVITIYKNIVDFKGFLNLSHLGLFATGDFTSDNFSFSSRNIEIKSGEIIGEVDNLRSRANFKETSFVLTDGLLNYFPYENTFLIKSKSDKLLLYSKFNFDGDLYFDGVNLNGSGIFESKQININAAHHYFSENNIMSADATMSIFNPFSLKNYIASKGLTVEQNLLSDSIYVFRSNHSFELPMLNHIVDFDVFVYDLTLQSIAFYNNDPYEDGKLINTQYGKRGFEYQALNANYFIEKNEFCIYSVFPLKLKKILLQPESNQFCVKGGDFPIFKNSTLIKDRKLFKDKLYNHIDVKLNKSLKVDIINN